MKFTHIQSREDSFESRYFDFQKSHKYLVELDDNNFIETTGFEHFLNDRRTDLAIDISTMVGCPMKCAFCASSSIPFHRHLKAEEMVNQVEFLINEYNAPDLDQITCSFQGIGEPTLIPEQIIHASKTLILLDPRIVLSLSTIFADLDGLMRIVNSGIIFDNLQFTLCGTRQNELVMLAPQALSPDRLSGVVKELSLFDNLKKVKVNYILIRGVNDSDTDLHYLIDNFKDSGVILKISSLNQTKSSNKHGLISGTIDRSIEFKEELIKNGIDSFIFGPFKNIEISCGQLKMLEDI